MENENLKDCLIDIISKAQSQYNDTVSLLKYYYYDTAERQKLIEQERIIMSILMPSIKKLPGFKIEYLPDGRIDFDFDKDMWGG